MKLVFYLKDAKGNILVSYDTDESIFERLFVQVSDGLGLTRPTVEESANSLDGLRLRRQRRLTNDQKEAVLNSQELSGVQKDLLYHLDAYILNPGVRVFGMSGKENIEKFFDAIFNFELKQFVINDCLDDIKEWYEEVDLSAIVYLEVHKREE